MIRNAAILTFHRIHNHGALLQAYALQRTILGFGIACDLLDLRLPRDAGYRASRRNDEWLKLINKTPSREFGVSRMKTFLARRLEHVITRESRIRFQEFQDHYLRRSTDTYANPEALYDNPPFYDAFVTGSDQVWNPGIGGGLSPEPFFLTFAPQGTARIAYAPSFGTQQLGPLVQEHYKEWLRKIDHLSVRESQGVETIRLLTGLSAARVLDPTFLLDGEDWRALARTPDISKPYVFCYSIGRDRNLMKCCYRIKEQTGFPIYKISRPRQAMNDVVDRNIHAVTNAGPLELLGYMSRSAIVVTNSFHGTALSINMRIPFLVVNDTTSSSHSRSSRLTSLLDLLGLTGRMIDNVNPGSTIETTINYTMPFERLNHERQISLAFLKKALGRS